MTEHGTKTAADLQRRLHALPSDAEEMFRLAYRAMVLDAFQKLPRGVLPHDLGSMGIMVEAAELFAGAIYYLRGNMMTKGFVGDDLDILQEWLQRCRSLFERYGDVYSELTPPQPTAGDPQKVAAAYWGTVNQLFHHILEHADIGESAGRESGNDDEELEQSQALVAITASTFRDIARALGTVMCCWFRPPYVDAVMSDIEAGAEALCQCRALMTVPDSGCTRGNA